MLVLLGAIFMVTCQPAHTQGPWWNPGADGNKFKVGDRVYSDISKMSGTVTGGPDASGYIKVQMDGSTGESALNPKWLKPAGPAAAPTPQGNETAGNNGNAQAPQAQAPQAQPAANSGQWWNPGAGGSTFKIGDRVFSEISKYFGTVVGGPDQFGYIQVKMDGAIGSSALNPKWLKPAGQGAPPAPQMTPAQVATNGAQAPNTTPNNPVNQTPGGSKFVYNGGFWPTTHGQQQDMSRLGQADPPPPKNAPPTADTFKQLIRSHNFPDSGSTTTTDFQQFDMLGQAPINIDYAGNLAQGTILGGPGNTANSYKVHTKYAVRTSYPNPNTPDALRNYDTDIFFYKDGNGDWQMQIANPMWIGETQKIIKD